MMMRLEAPKPLTEALVAMVLSLAFIQNMRSGETSSPARRVMRWSSGTSTGALVESCSSFFEEGAVTDGRRKMAHKREAEKKNQKKQAQHGRHFLIAQIKSTPKKT